MNEDAIVIEGTPFDAAPFARPLEEGVGLVWEEPREIHAVRVEFVEPPPTDLRLEYWRVKWPQVRVPREHIGGGGSVGWWELGNWHTGQWEVADTLVSVDGASVGFTFRPLNQAEFPDLTDFPATFRTTLKLRLVAGEPLPAVEAIEALTDATWALDTVTALLATAPERPPIIEVFNGHLESVRETARGSYAMAVWRPVSDNPNSTDRALLTVHADETVTVALDDLRAGPVCVPELGVCIVAGEECGQYLDVLARVIADQPRTVYEMVDDLPEQTWSRAWARMPRKTSRIYLPLSVDGGRHKFRLDPDGSLTYRTNNELLIGCPGAETARLQADVAPLRLCLGLPTELVTRALDDDCLPICTSVWQQDDIRIEQTAFATTLAGADPAGPPPEADALGVVMMRLCLTNVGQSAAEGTLALTSSAGGEDEALWAASDGLVSAGDTLRAIVETGSQGKLSVDGGAITYSSALEPGENRCVIVKIPYVAPEGGELAQLQALDFDHEREAVAGYWRGRLDAGMRLTTPEQQLNGFHRAHAGHLLINCEKEPGSGNRFARVGSFHYAAFGNESCMMIVDLDRRGYHQEARQCLQAFAQYQGTVPLPGDYSSHDGVLYGAHGYEHGGYNQHHGWILWCFVEHYRFTRDADWLAQVAPNLIAGADWIIRERARTVGWDDIGAGLLPHGSLEDIADWWQWLSTNAYSWRGLDAAAWGVERTGHAEAPRLRAEADAYRAAILRCFEAAMRRSPVVRLRNGLYVPHIPSHPHRRGRSFGWICETLEGAMHLLFTGLIAPDDPRARWIISDYEDNLYLSDDYGYSVDDFARRWFDWGGFSMQACLLLNPEPYLHRDDVKHALRSIFNAIAAGYFPDLQMLCEHALPDLSQWRGDHYKSSDEANACGWLRFLFAREDGDELLLGQAIPREWLKPGSSIGIERAATYFGPMSLRYEATADAITATLDAPRRNPPARIRLRFRAPEGKRVCAVTVNGVGWEDRDGEWVNLPCDAGEAVVVARLDG